MLDSLVGWGGDSHPYPFFTQSTLLGSQSLHLGSCLPHQIPVTPLM